MDLAHRPLLQTKIIDGLPVIEVQPPIGMKRGRYECTRCHREFRAGALAQKSLCARCWRVVGLLVLGQKTVERSEWLS